MARVPNITVLGSCRVDDPIRAMERDGRAAMNQQNIFGYVHTSREVLQQLDIISGRLEIPSRLRPFLNIRGKWAWQPAAPDTAIGYRFARTDAFVVEISSIRLLRFKAVHLQINRTRELLANNPRLERDWWNKLVHDGQNDVAAYEEGRDVTAPKAHVEVATAAFCSEQSVDDVYDDILRIDELLPAPVLFVSHFNTTATGETVRQRQAIVDAMHEAGARRGIAWYDPTELVRKVGADKAIHDPAHYREDFIPLVGEKLLEKVAELVEHRRTTPRRTIDLYEMLPD